MKLPLHTRLLLRYLPAIPRLRLAFRNRRKDEPDLRVWEFALRAAFMLYLRWKQDGEVTRRTLGVVYDVNLSHIAGEARLVEDVRRGFDPAVLRDQQEEVYRKAHIYDQLAGVLN